MKFKKIIITLFITVGLISSIVITNHYFNQNDICCSLNELDSFELHITDKDPSTLGVKEWLDDFNHLYDFIEKNYAYLPLKERTHGYNWLELKQVYAERINQAKNNEDFLAIIMDATQALQNRHSCVMCPESLSYYHSYYKNMYPFCKVFCNDVLKASEYWESIYECCYDEKYCCKFESLIIYEKGDYVVHHQSDSSDMFVGERLIVKAVNGIQVDDAIKDCFEEDYIDWDFQRNKSYIWMISPRTFGKNALFTLEDSEGSEIAMSFCCEKDYSIQPYSYPEMPLDFKIWPEKNTCYMNVQTFDLIIDGYSKAFRNFYKQIVDYEHLIIDIRGNTGGFYSTWINNIVLPLLSKEEKLQFYLAFKTDEYISCFRESYELTSNVPKCSFDWLPPEVQTDEYNIYDYSFSFYPIYETTFNGEIILLTDNVVYSAAEAFTSFCKQTGFATIYGTTSGGDGITPWPLYYVLPNSKIVIQLPSAMGLDHLGNANEEVRTQPDVVYESDFGYYNELIEYVLSVI
ncbi:MAG: hypothetical protein H7641_15030 [Candidatus Heimdallarchaeota archaeon]|nr:hypothetical protein [Candidatus Heimdallarchaeota archaeon]MCK4878877.1 hypothetical protein [Candidatus Heimdallarchaeota archaeon]